MVALNFKKGENVNFDAGYPLYMGPKSRCDFCEEIFRDGDAVFFISIIGYIFCATVDIEGKDCADKWIKGHKVKIDKSAIHFKIFSKPRRPPISDDDHLVG